jgi:hypothetical protein
MRVGPAFQRGAYRTLTDVRPSLPKLEPAAQAELLDLPKQAQNAEVVRRQAIK